MTSNAAEPGDPALQARAAAGWQRAQADLFGTLTMAPEHYVPAVTVLGAVLTRLRELTQDTAGLVSIADTVPDLVVEQAESRGISLLGLDPVQLAQAALAQRHREVQALEADRRRRQRLDDASSTGTGGWVVLEESGDPSGDPFRPYHRLEADTATGQALMVLAVPDEDFAGCEHSVTRLRIDLGTGALLDPDDAGRGGSPTAVADALEREELVALLRARWSPGGVAPPDESVG